MTSFGWKRKQPTICHQNFESEDDQDENSEEIDWLTGSKRARGGALENARVKAERLRSDGSILAESGRYWEAVRIWDEALSLVPDDARVHEMKSQAFIELREDFEAVCSAEEAVRCDPLWSVARQTLGRAQLNMGEVQMALKNFCIALHLAPWSEDIRQEDIQWTLSILEKAKEKSREKVEECEPTNGHSQSKFDKIQLR